MNPEVQEIPETEKKTNKIKCDFCHKCTIDPLLLGPMYRLDGITVHYFCMLFSAGLSQNGEDNEGILGFLPPDIQKELSRGKKLKCKYCREIRATVGCSVKSCKFSFHFPCGLENGSLFQFIGNYESYCSTHKKKTEIQLDRRYWDCLICYTKVKDEHVPVFPPCCKKAVFHRKCIMEMAVNSGAHFFKCPLCNDKEKFSKAMRTAGVYVPERDAAWELEPDAFADLNQQYSTCDVEPCKCPDGRNYDSKDKEDMKWKIIRCGACGAAAVHKECGKLEFLTYRCDMCSKVLKDGLAFNENNEESFPNQRRGIIRNRELRITRRVYDSSSSDDEGSPVPNILNLISQRPTIEFEEKIKFDTQIENSYVGPRRDVLPTASTCSMKIYGHAYKVVCPVEDEESSEDDEASEDDVEDFVLTSEERQVRNTSKRLARYWRRRFRTYHKNKTRKNETILNDIDRSRHLCRVKEFKIMVDNMKKLSAQITQPSNCNAASKHDNQLSEVRTGLVEVSESPGDELGFLSTAVSRCIPSSRSLKSNVAYPIIKPVEAENKSPELLAGSADKLSDISKRIIPLNSEVYINESKKEECPNQEPNNDELVPRTLMNDIISKFQEKISEILPSTKGTFKNLKMNNQEAKELNPLQRSQISSSKNQCDRNTNKPESDEVKSVTRKRKRNYTRNKSAEPEKTKKADIVSKDKVCQKPRVRQRARSNEVTPIKNSPSAISKNTSAGKVEFSSSSGLCEKSSENTDSEPLIVFQSSPSPLKSNFRQSRLDSWVTSPKKSSASSVFQQDGTRMFINCDDEVATNSQGGSRSVLSAVLQSMKEKSCKLPQSAESTSTNSTLVTKFSDESLQNVEDDTDTALVEGEVPCMEVLRDQFNEPFLVDSDTANYTIDLSDADADSDVECLTIEPRGAYKKTETLQSINPNDNVKQQKHHDANVINSTPAKDLQKPEARNESDNDDDVQIEKIVNLVKPITEPERSATPTATLCHLIGANDEWEDKKVLPSPKFFTGVNKLLSAALVGNAASIFESARKQRRIKYREKLDKTGPGSSDCEIIILDSDDDDEESTSHGPNESESLCDQTSPSSEQQAPPASDTNSGGNVEMPKPNRDENGNKSVKRTRAGSEDLEIAEVSKRHRVTE